MVTFQQIISICVTTSKLVHGYVLIAADMDDFKNLAHTFLSPDVAHKLTGLVSKSKHDSIRTQDMIHEVPFSNIGNVVKDEMLKSYITPNDTKVTSSFDLNRRYRTVYVKIYKDNEDNIEMQSTRAKIESVFTKDDISNILHDADDKSYKYDYRKDDYASKSKEKDNFSRDDKPTGLFDKLIDHNTNDNDKLKKLDYTETKLGDWNYIPALTQKPVKIKNVKSGYVFQLDKKNDRNTYDFNEKWELETQGLDKDNVYTRHLDSWKDGDTMKTTKELHVGLNNAVRHDLHSKLQKIEQQEKYKKQKKTSFDKFDSFEFTPPESKNKPNKQREYDIFYQDLEGSKQDNANKESTEKHSKEDNDRYEPKIEFENRFKDTTKDDIREVVQHDTFNNKKINKALRYENIMHGEHISGFKKYPNDMEENTYKNEKKSHNLEPIGKKIREKTPGNKILDDNEMFQKYDLNYKSDTSNEKYTNDKDDLRDKDDHKRKPNKQLIEKHDTYEKYALNYKSDDSHETKVHNKQPYDSDRNIGSINKNYEDKNENKKEWYNIEPKDHNFFNDKSYKQSVEDNGMHDKHFSNFKPGANHETKVYHQLHDSDGNLDIKNKYKDGNWNTEDSYNIESKEKQLEKRKPYKSLIEENRSNGFETKDDQQKYSSKTNHRLINQFKDNDKNDKLSLDSKDKKSKKESQYSREEDIKHDIYTSKYTFKYHRTSTDGPEMKKKFNYEDSDQEKRKQHKSTTKGQFFINKKHVKNGSKESESKYQFVPEDLNKQSDEKSNFKKIVTGPIKPTSNRGLFIKNRPKAPFKENSKHHFGNEQKKLLPEESDSDSDNKRLVTVPIKVFTGYIIDSDETKSGVKEKNGVGGKPIKKFTMKGTDIPKRQFYTMSSPDYYHKLPKVVEKYDFSEPIPEADRTHNVAKHVKREPAMINRKIRLS